MFVRDSTHGRVMDVVMLGPRGVGKTSLLASLYDQFPSVVGESALELSVTDGTTRSLLQGYREDLRRFARGGPARDRGVGGTTNLRQYLLGLGTNGKRPPQMTLRFTDMPGVLLDKSDGHAERVKLNQILPTASVIFVAIDSPAMLERRGVYNEEINKPAHVSEFVKDAVTTTGHKLVVFVPLKCERYAASAADLTQLTVEVKRHYRSLIDGFASAPHVFCGAVLTTVQTVGSMHFSRFETGTYGEPCEVFRLSRFGATYDPRDTDQPLRWMLRFAVNGFMARDKTVGEAFRDWWNDTDHTLTQALRKFGAACKEDEGFEILHRHPYLELP